MYNVFVYTYFFRFKPGMSSDFTVRLTGAGGTWENEFTNVKATYGSMLNLLFHTPFELGRLQEISIQLMDPQATWHVDRVIVCDSMLSENVLFRVNGCVDRKVTVVSRAAKEGQ